MSLERSYTRFGISAKQEIEQSNMSSSQKKEWIHMIKEFSGRYELLKELLKINEEYQKLDEIPQEPAEPINTDSFRFCLLEDLESENECPPIETLEIDFSKKIGFRVEANRFQYEINIITDEIEGRHEFIKNKLDVLKTFLHFDRQNNKGKYLDNPKKSSVVCTIS